MNDKQRGTQRNYTMVQKSHTSDLHSLFGYGGEGATVFSGIDYPF